MAREKKPKFRGLLRVLADLILLLARKGVITQAEANELLFEK